MKIPIALLLTLLFSFFLVENSQAAIRPASAMDSVSATSSVPVSSVGTERSLAKKERRIQRFFAKLKKWAKQKKRTTLPDAKRSLTISLALLGLSIVLFAISSQVGFLSIIGSVTMLGAIVFFVLWLVQFTRGRGTLPLDE